jgi:hypothetical protein
MLKVQYKLLIESLTGHVTHPILSRTLVGRGAYYGIIMDQHKQNIEDRFANFSLVGGSAIVQMDKALEGLPVGTYIDRALIPETGLPPDRMVEVVKHDREIVFVRPSRDFDYWERVPQKSGVPGVDGLEDELIRNSSSSEETAQKLRPWKDAVMGECLMIARRSVVAGRDEES